MPYQTLIASMLHKSAAGCLVDLPSSRASRPSEMPQNIGELGASEASSESDDLYCLLEDDNLVTHLSVTTDRLLLPVSHSLEIVALLHVNVKVTRATIDYFGLGM